MLQNRPEHIPENQWGQMEASLDDVYAQVFGPERPGRVRCLGRGPTPSKLVRRSTVTTQDIENSGMVVELKTQVKELSDQVKGMTMFIQQIISTSTDEQARAWAASFAVAFANIPNPTFANMPTPQNHDQNKLPQKKAFVSLSKCFDNMMKHDPSTQMVEDKVCMLNPMSDLINRLVLFVSYMSEEDLKKYPSRQNEELELKDQETSITSGQ
ncbi:hypothetical protein F2Q70_00027474 [Brassica cretica]|uniref:Uncharacterized protein n=1 Tax=Brassica cretica TaxID=69181 RepID=A0A8S9LHA3_BRACR|nr:hypothetical protein F2Q70_00027474 [Brassica cretica]